MRNLFKSELMGSVALRSATFSQADKSLVVRMCVCVCVCVSQAANLPKETGDTSEPPAAERQV